MLRTPLSDYLRYECEMGLHLQRHCREDVRILDLATAPPGTDVLLGVGDFYLVDDEHAVHINDDEAGRFHHAVAVDSALLASYRALTEAAWTLAEPFTAWWSRHPEQHRAGSAA